MIHYTFYYIYSSNCIAHFIFNYQLLNYRQIHNKIMIKCWLKHPAIMHLKLIKRGKIFEGVF